MKVLIVHLAQVSRSSAFAHAVLTICYHYTLAVDHADQPVLMTVANTTQTHIYTQTIDADSWRKAWCT
jgi:hypothetical protein